MSFFYTFFSYLGATYLIGLIAGFMYAFDRKFFAGFVGGIITIIVAAIIFSGESLTSSGGNSEWSWAAFLGCIGLFTGFFSGEKAFEAAFKGNKQ
jgi:hypothetical protein